MSMSTVLGISQERDTLWAYVQDLPKINEHHIVRSYKTKTNDSTFIQVMLYDNGAIYSATEFKFAVLGFLGDVRNGMSYKYYPHGTLQSCGIWNSGKEMSWSSFDQEGRINAIHLSVAGHEDYDKKKVYFFNNGQPELIELESSKFGTVSQEWYCENGQKIISTKIQEHYFHKEWVPDTNYVEYYCNGQLKLKYQYSMYNVHIGFGKCYEWNENGTPKIKFQNALFWSDSLGDYLTSQVGVWKFYDTSGKLFRKAVFRKGKKIKDKVFFECPECEYSHLIGNYHR